MLALQPPGLSLQPTALVHEAYLEDETVRDFIAEHNAPALREMAARFQEAIDRGLWQPRSNSARALLSALMS